MQRHASLTSIIRALFLLCVIAIGCGAPHSRKGGDATGSASEALSFTGIGDVASVTPGLQCVADFSTPNAVGSFVAVFRATNVSSQTVVVPLGPTNQISPTPAGAGPPTSFAPGTQYFPVSFVAHLFESITWPLGTRTEALLAPPRLASSRRVSLARSFKPRRARYRCVSTLTKCWRTRSSRPKPTRLGSRREPFPQRFPSHRTARPRT